MPTSYFRRSWISALRGFLLAVAFQESFLTDAHQVFFTRRSVRRAELRVFLGGGGVELDVDVAALGDFQRGVTGTGDVREEFAHLLRRLEIHLRRVAHPVLIDQQVTGADADHHVVRLVVGAVEEVHVVRGHRLEPEFRGELEQAGSDDALRHLQAVVVDFHVNVFLAVDVHQLRHRFAGLFLIAGAQPFVDRAPRCSR